MSPALFLWYSPFFMYTEHVQFLLSIFVTAHFHQFRQHWHILAGILDRYELTVAGRLAVDLPKHCAQSLAWTTLVHHRRSVIWAHLGHEQKIIAIK